eukprot:Nk52_evm4s296 gene=Nk52_evmTU4s296
MGLRSIANAVKHHSLSLDISDNYLNTKTKAGDGKAILELLMEKLPVRLAMDHFYTLPGKNGKAKASIDDLTCELDYSINKESGRSDAADMGYALLALSGELFNLPNISRCSVFHCPTPYGCLVQALDRNGGECMNTTSAVFDSFSIYNPNFTEK